MKAIAIVSGGMDSVTLAYLLKSKKYDLYLLSFDYGQRHKKELDYARLTAKFLEAQHRIIDLSNIGLFGSALTDDIPVPDGHYAEETMKITVVPNRNAIMLAIAYGVAVVEQAQTVAIGVHTGDHFIYPDCRPDFIRSFNQMQRVAIEGFGQAELYAPFINRSKADIVTIGNHLGVPYQDTWSCYKGGAIHCGSCGTCVERKEAFELANVIDPTNYEVK